MQFLGYLTFGLCYCNNFFANNRFVGNLCTKYFLSTFHFHFFQIHSSHFILFSLFQVSNAAPSDWLIPATRKGDNWQSYELVMLLLHWLPL